MENNQHDGVYVRRQRGQQRLYIEHSRAAGCSNRYDPGCNAMTSIHFARDVTSRVTTASEIRNSHRLKKQKGSIRVSCWH